MEYDTVTLYYNAQSKTKHRSILFSENYLILMLERVIVHLHRNHNRIVKTHWVGAVDVTNFYI